MFKHAFNALLIIGGVYFLADIFGLDDIKNIMIFFAAVAFVAIFT